MEERRNWGWGILALLLGYTVFAHQGLGLAKASARPAWWHPTGFLNDWPIIGPASETWWVGTLIILIPALLMGIAVLIGTRSSIARAIAITCVLLVAMFGFYGYQADGIWEFFHWRASLLFLSLAAVVGFTLASPWLAASWLRLHWAGKLIIYVPLFLLIVGLERHATGWDANMAMNFSPWPAVPVIGLEIGAYTLIGFLFGMAIGVWGLSIFRKNGFVGILGIALGVAFPALWFAGRFTQTETTGIITLLVLSAILIALGAVTRGEGREHRLRQRALHLGLGATLAFFPLFVGRSMSLADYSASRFVHAQTLIDALHTHYTEEGLYPDELNELIELEYLPELPRPQVGFDVVYALGLSKAPEFEYRSLGSSYVLEFVSTEWIQCAYNPPWLEDDGDEGDGAEDSEYEDRYNYDNFEYGRGDEEGYEEYEEYADEELDAEENVTDSEEDAADDADADGEDELWSCPSSRPQLW
jgi:hypothetical protein